MNTSKRRLAVASVAQPLAVGRGLRQRRRAHDDRRPPTTEASTPPRPAARRPRRRPPKPGPRPPHRRDRGRDDRLRGAQGELVASGATFPKGFYEEAIADFAGIAPDLIVNYGGGGSRQGSQRPAEQVVDFAGTDGTVKEEDIAAVQGRRVPLLPHRVAPITVSYNLDGVDELQLSAETIAKIFQREITNWDDAAIAADNPDATLPGPSIVVPVAPTARAPPRTSPSS